MYIRYPSVTSFLMVETISLQTRSKHPPSSFLPRYDTLYCLNCSPVDLRRTVRFTPSHQEYKYQSFVSEVSNPLWENSRRLSPFNWSGGQQDTDVGSEIPDLCLYDCLWYWVWLGSKSYPVVLLETSRKTLPRVNTN